MTESSQRPGQGAHYVGQSSRFGERHAFRGRDGNMHDEESSKL
jgi:hypothetical protein